MPVLRVVTDEDTHALIGAFCEARGRSMSSWAREQLLGAIQRQAGPAVQLADMPDDEEKVAVRVWLTPSEIRALDARATSSGQARATCAALLVRGALSGEPQFGPEDRAMLNQVRASMGDLARAIAGLVRAAKTRGSPARLDARQLQDLENEVRGANKAIVDVLAASRQRWRLLS